MRTTVLMPVKSTTASAIINTPPTVPIADTPVRSTVTPPENSTSPITPTALTPVKSAVADA